LQGNWIGLGGRALEVEKGMRGEGRTLHLPWACLWQKQTLTPPEKVIENICYRLFSHAQLLFPTDCWLVHYVTIFSKLTMFFSSTEYPQSVKDGRHFERRDN
jgi:hypothetical protein